MKYKLVQITPMSQSYLRWINHEYEKKNIFKLHTSDRISDCDQPWVTFQICDISTFSINKYREFVYNEVQGTLDLSSL
jgi:hypothetical protein